MKKTLLLTLAILSALFSAKATHMMGQSISVENLGNGKYVFTVYLYRECGMTAANLPASANLTNNAGVNISCQIVSQTDMSPVCYNSTIACGTGSTGYGAIEMGIYKSPQITLLGSPPLGGWKFTWGSCCRPGSIVNTSSTSMAALTTIHTTSPFPTQAQTHKQMTFETGDTNSISMGLMNNGYDSVWYKLSNILITTSTFPIPGTYNTGYSAVSPLPSSVQNSNNTGLSFDGSTGIGTFYSVDAGLFGVAVIAECYMNGQLVVETHQEFPIVILASSSGSSSNNKPSTIVSLKDSTKNTITKLGTDHYRISANVQDSIRLTLSAFDSDFNPNFVSQSITMDLLSGDTVNTNCSNKPCLTLNSLNVGGGYVSTLNNQVEFNFFKSSSSSPSSTYYYVVRFRDDACPVPKERVISLEIEYNSPFYSQQSSYNICIGDTVFPNVQGATQNLKWTPNSEITSVYGANPGIFPTSSTTYTATDTVTGVSMNLLIHVLDTNIKPLVTSSGTHVSISNGDDYDQYDWYFNGLNIASNTDSVPLFSSGSYYVIAEYGACTFYSDTQKVNMKTSIPLNDDQGEAIVGSGPATWTYDLSNVSGYSNKIDSIVILTPDMSSGKTTSMVTLTIKQNGSVWFTDTAAYQTDFRQIFPINKSLHPGSAYVMEVSTTETDFALFKPSSFPYTENTGILQADNPTRNGIAADGIPYVIFEMRSSIGITEPSTVSIDVFPNPANGFLRITGDVSTQVKVYNVSGIQVSTFEFDNEIELNTSEWAEGMYTLHIRTGSNTVTKNLMIVH